MSTLAAWLQGNGVTDFVCHLAAQSDVYYCRTRSFIVHVPQLCNNNIIYTLRLAKLTFPSFVTTARIFVVICYRNFVLWAVAERRKLRNTGVSVRLKTKPDHTTYKPYYTIYNKFSA